MFQYTSMSSVINSAGWRTWSGDDVEPCCAEYGEYQNSGEGSEGERVSFSEELSAPVAIEEILGSSYASEAWFDASYFAGNGADVGDS